MQLTILMIDTTKSNLMMHPKRLITFSANNRHLQALPIIQREAYPSELLAVGLREYREIYFKPYRIIYRIIAQHVYVMVIADGLSDMQSLLRRRLLQV